MSLSKSVQTPEVLSKENPMQFSNSDTDSARSNKTPYKPVQSTVQSKHTTLPSISKDNILLIGSSILHGINNRGLKHCVRKHAISGAKIQTIMEDLKIYDLSKFTKIVLYIGGNNASEGTDLELFEELYDQLLNYIHKQNQSCQVVLSEMAPRGDCDVLDINEVIQRLASEWKCDIVYNYMSFLDDEGQVMQHLFGKIDKIHLSTKGVEKLAKKYKCSYSCSLVLQSHYKLHPSP